MENSLLYNLIKFLEYGTNLHIGVLFLDDYGNNETILPKNHTIHTAPICERFKKRSKRSFDKCFKCRNIAIKKAITEKKSFGGLCINGVYEYIHPLIIDNNVACIIFIGNILEYTKGYSKILKKLDKTDNFSHTLEGAFDEEKCEKLSLLIETYIRMLLRQYSSDNKKINPLIENIKNYINSNLEFNVELAHISKLFNYNEKYIGRLFKKECGITISEYANKQRLEQAESMLENTNNTIIEISLRSGFRNVTYFNRMFKKTFGVTPTEYRNSFSN